VKQAGPSLFVLRDTRLLIGRINSRTAPRRRTYGLDRSGLRSSGIAALRPFRLETLLLQSSEFYICFSTIGGIRQWNRCPAFRGRGFRSQRLRRARGFRSQGLGCRRRRWSALEAIRVLGCRDTNESDYGYKNDATPAVVHNFESPIRLLRSPRIPLLDHGFVQEALKNDLQ